MLCDRILDSFVIFMEDIFWWIEVVLFYFVKIILKKKVSFDRSGLWPQSVI